jgi:hypothetical protein
MRRGVLSENGMPTNDDNLVMARSALAEAIVSTLTTHPGEYYLPDTESFITSLTKITGTVRTAIKSVARTIVQHKYELGLNIWDTSSEVAHKLRIVPALTTHLQCLFTSEDMVSPFVLLMGCPDA